MEPLSRDALASVDFSDPNSLLDYASKLEGHTFREILELEIFPDESGENRGKVEYSALSFKGGLGTLVEERYFGYKANDNPAPDFEEAGLELKTTCYDVNAKGEKRAGERLVLCMLAFDETIEKPFSQSHAWEKGGSILLIYYGRNKSVDKYDQEITYVTLFTPSEKDLAIIEQDYATIQRYVMEGRADELSESMTNYLGACTKGASAEKSMRDQKVYAPGKKARGRAWCYKSSYMNAVLNDYIVAFRGDGGASVGEPADGEIVKDVGRLKALGFDDYVTSLVRPYVGMTDKEICAAFDLRYTGNKAQWTSIVYRTLGIKGNHAEEFAKANVSVRTVRVKPDGRIRESLSLTPFRFLDLVEETWEESPLRAYFVDTRFFFVVFQETADGYKLMGARFWSMPVSDVEGPLRDCWQTTKSAIEAGIQLVEKVDDSGRRTISNNLPGKKDNAVAHVRPHSARAAYLLEDGREIGAIEQDADELPDGRRMTKQSFWLNNDYIRAIVDEVVREGSAAKG